METPEIREPKGTSFANLEEIKQICKYAAKMVEDLHITSDEITIITPYSYQVVF